MGVFAGPERKEELYSHLQESDAQAIVNSLGCEPPQALQCDLPDSSDAQEHIALESSGQIDHEKIEDNIASKAISVWQKPSPGSNHPLPARDEG